MMYHICRNVLPVPLRNLTFVFVASQDRFSFMFPLVAFILDHLITKPPGLSNRRLRVRKNYLKKIITSLVVDSLLVS